MAQAGVLALISLASRVGGWSRQRALRRLPVFSAGKVSREVMAKALNRNEFSLHYQPLYNGNGKLVALEALVRWNRGAEGVVSPGEFIPAAEQNGFILTLGDWILAKACRQIRHWQAAGHQMVPVAVNISACQLADSGFAARVLQIMTAEGVQASYLELEVTETAMMTHPHQARRQLRTLHRAGLRIAMDDFGVGYSSLSRLQDFPLHSIKIDRAFISRMRATRKPILLADMIEMGHHLGLVVTAEGVETEAQCRRLRQLGCDRVQGFFLAKPMPADHVEPLLKAPALNPFPA